MNVVMLNLFIINNDPSIVTGIKNYLDKRFGETINILTFNTGKDALLELNQNTNLVILDNYMEGENGTDIRKQIKKENHKTQVIMLCSNEDLAVAIEIYKQGELI